jgi:hypothetical protein
MNYCVTTGEGAAGYIAGWGPPSVTPAGAAFARAAVARCGDPGRERAKNLLWAAARLGDYGIGLGLTAAPEVLLHPSVIERCAPRSALLYRPRSGRGLEEVSVGLMADPDP